MVVLLLVVLAVIIMLWFKTSVGDEKYLQAVKFEREGRFREACYFYGVALYNGTGERKEAKDRVSGLWKKYGPFDYADIDAEACRLDAQGHSETLKIIKEIVAGNKAA